MDAWENSNFVMTATDHPLPAFTAMNIREHVDQWLADNGIAPTATVFAASAGSLGASSGDDYGLSDLADSLHGVAAPLMSIFKDIAGVVAGVAGVAIAGNALVAAFSDDTLAYDL